MNDQDALDMVWHMANMWLSELSQRFQVNEETNQMEDYLTDLLDSHYPQNTEEDAEKALRIVLDVIRDIPRVRETTLSSQEN
jgi:hypothetical protein